MQFYELNILASILVFVPAFFFFGIAWLCRGWSNQPISNQRALMGALFIAALIFGSLLTLIGFAVIA